MTGFDERTNSVGAYLSSAENLQEVFYLGRDIRDKYQQIETETIYEQCGHENKQCTCALRRLGLVRFCVPNQPQRIDSAVMSTACLVCNDNTILLCQGFVSGDDKRVPIRRYMCRALGVIALNCIHQHVRGGRCEEQCAKSDEHKNMQNNKAFL